MGVAVVRFYVPRVTSGVEHLVRRWTLYDSIEMCIPVLCPEVDTDVTFLNCSPRLLRQILLALAELGAHQFQVVQIVSLFCGFAVSAS